MTWSQERKHSKTGTSHPAAALGPSRSRRAWALACALALPLVYSLLAAAPGQAAEPERLEIVTASGPQLFQVEVMRNDADRIRGLMFRRFMPPDRGMLFDFQEEQPVMMWMRNTIIPLDMVFIARNGKIANIAENTEPMSERTIPSEGPVTAVLELNAGTAARTGMKKGDQVRHAMFGK